MNPHPDHGDILGGVRLMPDAPRKDATGDMTKLFYVGGIYPWQREVMAYLVATAPMPRDDDRAMALALTEEHKPGHKRTHLDRARQAQKAKADMIAKARK